MTMSSFGIMGIVCLLLFIVLLWVGPAVAVKRWHDRNKTGWWILIGLVTEGDHRESTKPMIYSRRLYDAIEPGP